MNQEVFDAIEALGKENKIIAAGKTKKVTVTLPIELVETIQHYKAALDLPTFSAALKHALIEYFNSLVIKNNEGRINE